MQSPKSTKSKFTKEELLHSLDLTLGESSRRPAGSGVPIGAPQPGLLRKAQPHVDNRKGLALKDNYRKRSRYPKDSSNPSRQPPFYSTARQAARQKLSDADNLSRSEAAPEISRRTTNKSHFKDYDVGSLYKRTVPMNSYSPVEVVGTIGPNGRSMDLSTSQTQSRSSSVLSPSKSTTQTRPSLLQSTRRSGASPSPETPQRSSPGVDSLLGQFTHPSPYFSPPAKSQGTQRLPLLASPTLRKRIRPCSIFVAQSDDDDEVEVRASPTTLSSANRSVNSKGHLSASKSTGGSYGGGSCGTSQLISNKAKPYRVPDSDEEVTPYTPTQAGMTRSTTTSQSPITSVDLASPPPPPNKSSSQKTPLQRRRFHDLDDQETLSPSPKDNPAHHRIMGLKKREDCLVKPSPLSPKDSSLATNSGYVSGPDSSSQSNTFATTTMENQSGKLSLRLDDVCIGNFTTGPAVVSSSSKPAWELQLVAEKKPPPLWPGHRSQPQWSLVKLVSHIPKVPSVAIPLSHLHLVEYYLETEPYMITIQTTSPLAVSFYRQYYVPHSLQMTKGLISCMLSQTPCHTIEAWLKQLHDHRSNSMAYRVVSMSEGRWSSVRELLRCLPASPPLFPSRRSLFDDNVGGQATPPASSSTPVITAKDPSDDDSAEKDSTAALRRSDSVTVTQDLGPGTSLRRSNRLRVDHRPLFVFPFSGVKSVTITTADVPRLDAGEYLNDSIIEFYLKFLQVNLRRDNPELADQIHIFNTFFYPQLTAKSARKLHPTCYDRVKSWTTKINLFNKRFIFIPIHEKAHWYLALICNPGRLTETDDKVEASPITQSTASETDSSSRVPEESTTDVIVSEAVSPMETVPSAIPIPSETDISTTESSSAPPVTDKATNKAPETGSIDAPVTVDISSPSPQTSKGVTLRSGIVVTNKTGWARSRGTNLRSRLRASLDPQTSPFIVLFDSLGLSHPQTFHILNDYLAREAETKNLSVKNKASGIYAKIPCQTNHCDCGIYLLQYVETFLRDPAHYLDVIIKHTTDTNVWFPQSQIAAKRESIKSLISQLTIEYQDYKKPAGETPATT
ncbi:hypothetical protein IWQ62_004103 [Dispira parvispora]|uniref:Ubiquitin-like protease family profile domain-containing protein n=1 Tax=Dispira parvispora TaxID=1520584 RepID=A0A9W8AT22_9FUNG|nr:hypothetical protein IWQ62_004103 [Dispira parvispora]